MRAPSPRSLAIASLAVVLASCGTEIDDRVTAEGTRALREAIDRKPQLDAGGETRFPMRGMAVTSGPLRWEVPAQWSTVSGSSMRIADFRFGDEAQGECYVSHLPGTAGGIAANVNRWRKQMGLGDLTEAEIASLPAIRLLGAPATLVDMEGTYQGMRDPQPKPGSRLLGAILSLGEMSIFVKMVGPAELVEQERDRFRSFCESIQFNRGA